MIINQLNHYNFHKFKASNACWSFRNPEFTRLGLGEVYPLTRKKRKTEKETQPMNTDGESIASEVTCLKEAMKKLRQTMNSQHELLKAISLSMTKPKGPRS